jgi:hypothetical protein
MKKRSFNREYLREDPAGFAADAVNLASLLFLLVVIGIPGVFFIILGIVVLFALPFMDVTGPVTVTEVLVTLAVIIGVPVLAVFLVKKFPPV